MIASENIRFYLDPLQAPTHTGDKVLVFRERYPRTYDSAVGKVAPVCKRIVDDHHLWWVHTDGRFIDGAVESPKELQSHTPALGILDDDVFVVGQAYGLTDDGRMVIRNAMRSDGKRLPGSDGQRPQSYMVHRWYQAASWAAECLPQPGDDQGIVDLRVTIAQQRFALRLGEICILREANNRDWRDDLEDLDYTLPTPVYAVAVSGSMFLPMGTQTPAAELSETAKAAVERVHARNFTPTPAVETFTTRVEVPVQMVVRTSFEKYEQVEEVNDYTIRNAAGDHFGVFDATIGSVTKTPLLRSTY